MTALPWLASPSICGHGQDFWRDGISVSAAEYEHHFYNVESEVNI